MTWTTFTPASEQELIAESSMLATLYKNDSWDEVGHSQRSSFLTEGTLIHDISANEAMFIIRAYAVACLFKVSWPQLCRVFLTCSNIRPRSSRSFLVIQTHRKIEVAPCGCTFGKCNHDQWSCAHVCRAQVHLA